MKNGSKSENMATNSLFSRYGGMIGSILILASMFIIAILRSEYDHLEHSFSELGRLGRKYAVMFNLISFVGSGICFYIFSLYLQQILEVRDLSTSGVLCLQGASIFWVLTGVFPLHQNNIINTLHLLMAFLAFILGGLAVLLIGIAFVEIRGYEWIAFISVMISFSIWIIMYMGTEELIPTLAQLIAIALFITWIFLVNIILVIRRDRLTTV